MLHQHYRSLAHRPASHDIDTKLACAGSAEGAAFDDWSDLALSPPYSISQVTIYYSDSRILGLQVQYAHSASEAPKVTTHCGPQQGTAALLSLANDEFIVGISGLIDDGISRLRLDTNRGQCVDVGSSRGTAFSLTIQQCYGLKAFTGRFSSSLQAIGGYQKPIFMRQSIENVLSPSPLKGPNVGYKDVFPRVPETAGIRRVGVKMTRAAVADLEVSYWDATPAVQLHFPGSSGQSDLICDVLDFEMGEMLTAVSGTIANGIITSLVLKTSLGRSRSWGEARGTPFLDEVRSGHRAAGIITLITDQGLAGVKLDVAYRPPRAIVSL